MIYYEKPATGYKNLSKKQIGELQEVFSCGCCWILAITLHRMFGYPISAVIDEEGCLEHAWVVRADGMEIDIMGANKVCWGKPTHTGMLESAFLKSFGSSPKQRLSLSDDQFVHCKQVVEEHLIPTYNLQYTG